MCVRERGTIVTQSMRAVSFCFSLTPNYLGHRQFSEPTTPSPYDALFAFLGEGTFTRFTLGVRSKTCMTIALCRNPTLSYCFFVYTPLLPCQLCNTANILTLQYFFRIPVARHLNHRKPHLLQRTNIVRKDGSQERIKRSRPLCEYKCTF